MSVWTNTLLLFSVSAAVVGISGLAFQLARVPPLGRPTLGIRGLKRSRAVRNGLIFPSLEPMVRLVAAWVSLLPIDAARNRARDAVVHAGDFLGLSEDELIAICALSGLVLGGTAVLICHLLEADGLFALLGLGLGLFVPWFRVAAVARQRARALGRALPSAVELAAMCMSAGLDFPGSLRRIVDSASDPTDPVIEEFGRILQELDLGHTRRSAMERFAARVPTEQVREFVNSVIQAEQKGTPLAAVLSIQAQTQRLRRSIAAEETASEAALMLLGPMTLIFLCVIALLLGPVVVRFMTGGIGPA